MDEGPYHHGNLRQALIVAALATIRDQGAGAVSLRGLARDLGVSHAAPARHFATRDALFAAIAEQGYQQLAACVAAAREPAGDPLAGLHRMARAHLGWARDNPGLYAAMRNPDVTRHADPALLARMRAFAAGQMAAVQAARATGWRKAEAADVTFLSIVTGLAGIGALMADPLLSVVLPGQGLPPAVDALVDRLLAP